MAVDNNTASHHDAALRTDNAAALRVPRFFLERLPLRNGREQRHFQRQESTQDKDEFWLHAASYLRPPLFARHPRTPRELLKDDT